MTRSVLFFILATPLSLTSVAHASDTDALARAAWRQGAAALRAVDATPAQRRAVGEAAERLAHRLQPFEQDVRALAHSAHDVWVSQTVTHSNVESVRSEAVSLLDDASAESVDFVVEVAEVLTPEQRAELVELARDAVLSMVRS